MILVAWGVGGGNNGGIIVGISVDNGGNKFVPLEGGIAVGNSSQKGLVSSGGNGGSFGPGRVTHGRVSPLTGVASWQNGRVSSAGKGGAPGPGG